MSAKCQKRKQKPASELWLMDHSQTKSKRNRAVGLTLFWMGGNSRISERSQRVVGYVGLWAVGVGEVLMINVVVPMAGNGSRFAETGRSIRNRSSRCCMTSG